MSAASIGTTLPTWREAWTRALYGPEGFFRRSRPGQHFRTSVHASPLFAEAVLRLARRHGLDHVIDVGAGGGELVATLHRLDPGIRLTAVEVAPRPPGLPEPVEWRPEPPENVEGLVVANEWLDNVPCDVVQVDDHGDVRLVHVDPSTGREELGRRVDDAWLDRWWPLTAPGTRAEIGRPRDEAWETVVRRLRRGVALAVDYGHTRASRPLLGSLRSYRDGREVDVVPDGSRDVTAHVAVDSLRADRVCRQREALLELGVDGSRPAWELARTDPAGYVRELSRAGEAGELLDKNGLGGFWWVFAGPVEGASWHVAGDL